MSTEHTDPLSVPAPIRDLPQLKRRAKELLRSFRQGDPEAVRTVEAHFDGADQKRFRLAQAQLVLARSLGFPSWTRLRAAADAVSPRRGERRQRTRPSWMHSRQYVYDVDAVDGDQAWALFEACRDGETETVRALLEADANLVHAQNWYTQPVHFAVYANHPEILSILLEAGAEPGRTRFMASGWKELLEHADHLEFEESRAVLLEALSRRFGFDPDFIRLEEAIRTREPDRVEAVLVERPQLARACDESGNNPIHWAVMTRQPDLIPSLVSHGADPDHRRSDGQTPAHLLLNGDYEYRTGRELKGLKYADEKTVLRALLDAGAHYGLSVACAAGDEARVRGTLEQDPDAARRLDSGRRSPLMYAARSGHLVIVRTLLEHGAEPNRPEELANDGQALFAASWHGHLAIVELLLEHGANPNAVSDSSGCCLGIAERWAGEDAGPIMETLRRYGATDPEWRLSVGDMRRALENDEPISRDFDFQLEALARNDLELAELLLRKDPTVVDRLHGGCLRLGSPDVAITEMAVLKLLLDAGFDPNRPDWLGKTALHHYAGRGEVGNALLVIEHGGDIDAIDDEFHGTPLAWAAKGGHEDAVRLLLEHGADPDLPVDIPQARPLACARAGGHARVIGLLDRVRDG